MALNPRLWYPIAVLLSIVNVIGAVFATRITPVPSPWHVGGHVVLAVAFGLWAQRLKSRQSAEVAEPDTVAELAVLRDEMAVVRREVAELQERLDFTERLLTQARDRQWLPAERQPPESV
ncbi:MAG: hypothetical protein ACRENB_08835 [Gemmatimonadales bacterium]